MRFEASHMLVLPTLLLEPSQKHHHLILDRLEREPSCLSFLSLSNYPFEFERDYLHFLAKCDLFFYYLSNILCSKESLHLDAPIVTVALVEHWNLEWNHAVTYHLLIKDLLALMPICWNEILVV